MTTMGEQKSKKTFQKNSNGDEEELYLNFVDILGTVARNCSSLVKKMQLNPAMKNCSTDGMATNVNNVSKCRD
uniref:Uncharacterized protein n=1 Tax=Romanomermis culicivorax TaxID=13658 RepID=A0A915HHG9_ROMCU